MSISLLTSILVLSYGMVFIHLAAFILARKEKLRLERMLGLLLLGFGLMCLVGGAGAIQDRPPAFFYAATFFLLLLLAPACALYIAAFLEDRNRPALMAVISSATAASLAIGFILGFTGHSWRRILSLAYADIALCILLAAIVEFRELAPLRGLPGRLKTLLWSIVGVELQVILLSFFQFLEVKPAMHALWLMVAMTLVAHCLLLSRDPESNKLYKAQADTIRQGKSRLDGIDIAARIAVLRALMARERLYRVPNLQLDGLAERVGLSGPQLSELLNRHIGKSFTAYINELRVEEARRLLVASPELGVLDICYECGFSSKSSFNAVFRRITGKTPSEFRADP